jgi:hypothetical protein
LLLSYLGVHVVGRGIVFVDLALGQISSLGVAFAAFIGTGLTTIPLVFTLAGALLMSFINIRDKRLKAGSDHWNTLCVRFSAYGIAYFKNTAWRFGYTGSIVRKYSFSKLGADHAHRHCLWNHCIGAWYFFQEIFYPD